MTERTLAFAMNLDEIELVLSATTPVASFCTPLRERLNEAKKKLKPEQDQLVEAYGDYVAFLTNQLKGSSSFLYSHGITASEEDVRKGQKMREQIASLKQAVYGGR